MKLNGIAIGFEERFFTDRSRVNLNLLEEVSNGPRKDGNPVKKSEYPIKVDISSEARAKYRERITAAKNEKILAEYDAIYKVDIRMFEGLSDSSEIFIDNAEGFNEYEAQFELSNTFIYCGAGIPVRFENVNEYWNKSIEEISSSLLNKYAKAYSDIVKGYEDGTREVYFTDETSETGYRKLTKEEELSYLNAAFNKEAKNIEYIIKDRIWRMEIHQKALKSKEELEKKLEVRGKKKATKPTPSAEQLEREEALKKKIEELKRLPPNISDYLVAAANKFVEEFTAKKGVGVDTESLFKNPFAQALTVSQ